MHSFLEKLASSDHRSQSSEQLKLLGKRAAGMYMQKEADSLTSAVGSAVADEGLSTEQIRRVSEMANQATWGSLFHDGGDTSAAFAPADADDVLASLAPSAEVQVYDTVGMDYLGDVPSPVTDSSILDDAFAVGNDTHAYGSTDPSHSELMVVEKTASAQDVARHGVDRVARFLEDASEDLYAMMKRAHVTDGVGLLQLSQAVGCSSMDTTFAADLVKVAHARMQSEGIRFDVQDEIVKVAQPLVLNTGHPLMAKVAEVERLSISYVSAHAGLREATTVHNNALYMWKAKMAEKSC